MEPLELFGTSNCTGVGAAVIGVTVISGATVMIGDTVSTGVTGSTGGNVSTGATTVRASDFGDLVAFVAVLFCVATTDCEPAVAGCAGEVEATPRGAKAG